MRTPGYRLDQTAMTPKTETCQIRGSIVEAIEIEGRSILRVALTGGSIDFVADPGETFHLGDTLILDGEFHPRCVRHALDEEIHPNLLDADFLS